MRAIMAAVLCGAIWVGCSALFDGNDLHGTKGGNDMAAGGGDGDDMAGGGSIDMSGGGGGGGGAGSGGGDMAHGVLTMSFTKGASLSTGPSPYNLVAGDFDHDGHLDAVTVNNGDSSLSFVFSDGTKLANTVSVAVPMAASGKPCSAYAIASGKVDADAIPDVVVTCTDQVKNNATFLYVGSATRTYSASQIMALSSTTASASFEGVALGDFNTDGKLDVAVSDYQSGNVWVAAGNGDGSFGASAKFAAGTGPVGVHAGDIDGDTHDDLVAYNYGAHTISILHQVSGALTPATAITTTGTTPDGLLADLNHDGKLDIVGADASGDQVVIALYTAADPGRLRQQPGRLRDQSHAGDARRRRLRQRRQPRRGRRRQRQQPDRHLSRPRRRDARHAHPGHRHRQRPRRRGRRLHRRRAARHRRVQRKRQRQRHPRHQQLALSRGCIRTHAP